MNKCGNWNKELIPKGGTYPRQYIEANAGISCCDTNSSLNFVLAKLNLKTGKFDKKLGSFELNERMNNWTVEKASTRIKFTTNKIGDQDHINITLS